MYRGEARASQVTGPSSSCVLWSNTPPDTFPSSPVCRRGALLPSMESSTLGIRKDIGFGAAVPRPARSSAYASPAVSPRPAQGWLPARAGSPLAGQDSHLLDDKQSFMKASHPPIPFDPQGLVALNSYRRLKHRPTSTGRACPRASVWRACQRGVDVQATMRRIPQRPQAGRDRVAGPIQLGGILYR